MSWTRVRAWWSGRQLTGRSRTSDDAQALAARFLGLHAQYTSAVELAVGVRNPALSADAVLAALWSDRTLVKTWAQRGTLHVLAAADLPLLVAASRDRRYHRDSGWLRQNGVTTDDVDAVLAHVPEILYGAVLTRAVLADEVARRTGRAHLGEILRNGFGELLKPVAFAGGLCFGPSRGREVTFTHPATWLGAAGPDATLSTSDAIDTVLLRYLGTYGPAAPADFARWWGGTSPAAVQPLFDRLHGAGRIVPVDVAGRHAYLPAGDVAEALAVPLGRAVRLLPAFDPHVVAAPRDVEAVLPAALKTRVYGFAGIFSPVVLVAGAMAGTWKHARRRRRLVVTVRGFAPLKPAVRTALDDEAQRLAVLLGSGSAEVVEEKP